MSEKGSRFFWNSESEIFIKFYLQLTFFLEFVIRSFVRYFTNNAQRIVWEKYLIKLRITNSKFVVLLDILLDFPPKKWKIGQIQKINCEQLIDN